LWKIAEELIHTFTSSFYHHALKIARKIARLPETNYFARLWGLQPPPQLIRLCIVLPLWVHRCCGWFAGRRTGVVVAFARWRWCCWRSVETRRSTVAQVVRLHASCQLAATYLRHCRGAGDRQTSTGRSRCQVPSTVSVGHSQQQPRAVGALTTRTIVCCNIIHYSVAVKNVKKCHTPTRSLCGVLISLSGPGPVVV